MELSYTLITDGSSDQALIPILDWVIAANGFTGIVSGEWCDFRLLKRSSNSSYQTRFCTDSGSIPVTSSSFTETQKEHCIPPILTWSFSRLLSILTDYRDIGRLLSGAATPVDRLHAQVQRPGKQSQRGDADVNLERGKEGQRPGNTQHRYHQRITDRTADC